MDEHNDPNAQSPSDDAADSQLSDTASAAETSPNAPVTAMPVPRRRFLVGSAALLAVVAGAGVAARQAFGERGVTPTPPPTLPPVIGIDPATPTPRRDPTPSVDERANGYVVTAPRTLRANGVETVSFALFDGSKPVSSKVAVSLADKSGKVVAQKSDWVYRGRGGIPIRLEALAAGEYTLRVSGKGFTDTATVRVEDGTLLFLETDKPIYKPGQTIRISRAGARPEPAAGRRRRRRSRRMDAKGIKVFKKPVTIDDFGMATLDLPLSTEPNLGVWKCAALARASRQRARSSTCASSATCCRSTR